jgi:hypothetical protein
MPAWLGVLLLVALWCVWWLWAVNWARLWPVLARGAWVPVVLLALVATIAWSRLAPASREWLGVSVPGFWWHLAAVAGLTAAALLCGWIQGRLGWAPEDVTFEPPPAAHDHGHGQH